jgi:hypothetical protein
MRHIPVGATIRAAYAFAFSNLGSIIGLIWVPMILITVAQFFTLYRYYNDFIDVMASGNAAQIGPSLLMVLGYCLAALLLYAMMLVAVVQLALGTRSHGAIVHFAFGPLEWRMFRALSAFALMLLFAGFAIVFAGNAAVAFTPVGSKLSQVAAGAILMLGALGIGVLLVPRFLLLLPAIAVSEAAPVLRRAWALSAGNFLRLFVVFLGLAMPVLCVAIAAEAALGSRTVPAGATQQVQLISAIMQARQSLPLTCGLSFLISPWVIGLFAGASVAAWRTLKDEPAVDITA